MAGGFGICGIPWNLIDSIYKHGYKDLHLVSNDCGVDNFGLDELIEAGRVRRMTCSFMGENRSIAKMYFDGDIEVELIPQGTLAEKLRAGGAGIPAFYTATGVGTMVEKGGFPIRFPKNGKGEIDSVGRERRNFGGKDFLLEESIKGDFSLVKAWKADEKGNLIFRKTARNFNPDCAMAGNICIAEVEEIVPSGSLDPDSIHLPDVFVDRIVLVEDK